MKEILVEWQTEVSQFWSVQGLGGMSAPIFDDTEVIDILWPIFISEVPTEFIFAVMAEE